MLSEMSIHPALKAAPDGLERWLQRAANSFAGIAAVKESKRLW
jgi:hypothetical protein